MRATRLRNGGFTLVEIMIVVAIIGLLAVIAIPNIIKARTRSQTNACINNLRQIDGAIQQWALETKQASTATVVESDIKPFMGRGSVGTLPFCPADSSVPPSFATSYTITDPSTRPLCQINDNVAAPYHRLQ